MLVCITKIKKIINEKCSQMYHSRNIANNKIIYDKKSYWNQFLFTSLNRAFQIKIWFNKFSLYIAYNFKTVKTIMH